MTNYASFYAQALSQAYPYQRRYGALHAREMPIRENYNSGELNWSYGIIKRSDLGRDRDEQRSERFQIGQKFDAMVTGFDRAKKPTFSVKAMQIAEEKQAVAQYGSSDSGASLGDILGEALKAKNEG